MPSNRPLNLNIRPIPTYTLPRPTPSLLSSISQISPTWRNAILNSVPFNLIDWFIPLDHRGHWEVYKHPLFPENEGRWKFEYKSAFALILDFFDDDFVREFKSITGISMGSGWGGMVDLMELMDCIEMFIERVKVSSPYFE